MDVSKYTYQVFWSEEDNEFVATVAEFPSLSWLDSDRSCAEQELLKLVAEVVEDMQVSGEVIPQPLGVIFGKIQRSNLSVAASQTSNGS